MSKFESINKGKCQKMEPKTAHFRIKEGATKLQEYRKDNDQNTNTHIDVNNKRKNKE